MNPRERKSQSTMESFIRDTNFVVFLGTINIILNILGISFIVHLQYIYESEATTLAINLFWTGLIIFCLTVVINVFMILAVKRKRYYIYLTIKWVVVSVIVCILLLFAGAKGIIPAEESIGYMKFTTTVTAIYLLYNLCKD